MTFDYRHVLRAGSIRLGEAANLWAGHDPAIISPMPKPGHAYRIFNNLKAQRGKLLPKKPADMRGGYMQMVTLDDLRRVAEAWGERPAFLYPEKQKRPKGEPRPETIEGRKEAHDLIKKGINVLGLRTSIRRAAAWAAQNSDKTPEALMRARRHYLSHQNKRSSEEAAKRQK